MDDARRCTLRGIDQTLQMRGHVSSAAAQAHWVRTAIAELRAVQGTQEQREALRREMRQLQEKSVDEVSSFEFPLDVSAFHARTMEVFSRLILPDALAHFAFIARPRPVEELKREALKVAEQSPISAMMNGIIFDAEGKITAEVPGAATSGTQSEDWFKRAITQNLQVQRHVVVAGNIEPARQAIASNFSIAERHFLPIVMLSPFVPPTHRYTFALGFARFMQGDLISAAHLIIPQLENSVRYVLHSSSPDSSKIMPDMLQEDRPLSALIDQYRSEMERIFTDRIVFEGLR